MIWFAVFFLSCAWQYLVTVFNPIDYFYGVTFVGLALIFIIISCFKNVEPEKSGLWYIFVGTLLAFILSVPFPYNFGAIIMLPAAFRYNGRVAVGFMITGFVLTVQAAFLPLFYIIAARYHEIKWINSFIWPSLSLLGINFGLSEGTLYFPTFETVHAFPSTLEKLGFLLLYNILIAGIVVISIFIRKWQKFLSFFLICMAYCYVRLIFMILLFIQVQRADIFWNPIIVSLSYFPLSVLLALFYRLENKTNSKIHIAMSPNFSGKALIMNILFFIGIFCIVGYWGFHDPGIRKQGRILIDEKHSNWEWTTHTFDTTWFGSQSTYNYYCMAEYFKNFYSVSYNTNEKLTDGVLSQADILILKTPTQAYDETEINAIESFVKKGGGLWLIADHTNIFGMNYFINFVAKRFGMFFHYDSTYDLLSGKLTYYKHPKIFPHPTVQNMTPFLFATSCTMDSPMTSDSAMIGYSLRTRMLAYSERGFFEQKPTQNYEFGVFLQGDTLKFGKGRVAAFTDSTCFSNFYMFIPSKPDLALSTMEWLNRKNYLAYFNKVLLIIGIFALVLGLYIGHNLKNTRLPCFICSGLLASAIGITLFTMINKTNYALPLPHKDFKTVSFERQYSDISLPIKELVDDKLNNYHTFYVWTQRMAYVPFVKDKLSEAVSSGDMVMIINPIKSFYKEDIELLKNYVKSGGKLLLLDGPHNKLSTANQLLADFQMQIDFAEIPKTFIYDNNKKLLGPVIKSGSVKGGNPFLMTDGNVPVFSVQKFGDGEVGVMSDSYIFSNPQMGDTQIVPDKTRQQIYSIEFYMLDVMENF